MTCWWFPAQTSCVIAAVGFQNYFGTSLPVMKRHKRGDGKASGSHALTPQLLLLLTSRDASGTDFNLPQDDWNYSKPKAKHILFPSLYYLRTYFTFRLIFTLWVMFYFIPMLLEAVHTSSLLRPKWTHYSYLSLYSCFFFFLSFSLRPLPEDGDSCGLTDNRASKWNMYTHRNVFSFLSIFIFFAHFLISLDLSFQIHPPLWM